MAPLSISVGRAGAFALMTLLVIGLDAGAAHAWKYHEHLRIGRQSYRCACAWLANETGAQIGDVSGDTAVCGEAPATKSGPVLKADLAKRLVEEVLCVGLEQTAFSYGQATALSGDHLGEPEDFRTIEGQRQTVGLLSYAQRALSDGDHFHPRNTLMWHRYHEEALALARKALRGLGTSDTPSEAMRQHFVDAVYVSAFADHFLQDAFAAGHMGFNRGATRPTAAMSYHNQHNFRGRIVQDRTGEKFWVHGDSQLHWDFEEGRARLLHAASASIFGVLIAIITGAADPALERHVSDRLPVAYLDADDKSLAQLNAFGRSSGVAHYTRGTWVPLSAMHDPAHVLFAPGLEYRHVTALTEESYERDQLTLLVSTEFDKAYGFRFDLGAGMGTSPLRGDGSASLHQRIGITFPIYAAYSSVLGYDLGLGAVVEECVAACTRSSSDDGIDERGLATGVLAFKINVEAGELLLLQGFVEGVLGADFGGSLVGGLGFGVVLGKPVRTTEPAPYSGPPI